MRTGYSLFLQEYVDPARVEYQDCRDFQIVCPECREPVFKVARESSATIVHYFSHYKKDETLNDQCELRVNRLSNAAIEETRRESRNQKLRLFLKVFQDIVWENEYTAETIQQARQRFVRLSRSEAFSDFKRISFEALRKTARDRNEILDFFDEALENLYQDLADFGSEFAIGLQKDFAYDFLLHLLAGHSKENFSFLFNHAFILCMTRLERKRREADLADWEAAMLHYLTSFLSTGNEKKRMQILARMGERPLVSPYSHQLIDYYAMFGSHLSYHADGVLLRIPYLKILKRQLGNPGDG